MKKKHLALLLVLSIPVLALLLIYVFIPRQLTITQVVQGKIPAVRAQDFFTQKTLARKWMPGNETDSCFCSNNTCFCFIDNGTNTVAVRTLLNKEQLFGYVYINRLSFDSAAISWTMKLPAAGSGPLARVRNYFAARKLKNSFRHYLEQLLRFSGNDSLLYGMRPVIERVADTLSLSQKKQFSHYPTVTEINDMLNELNVYITAAGANVVRPAMLHVLQTDKEQYEAMVALPINKPVSDKGNFILKRMPPGRIIAVTVQGGMYTINRQLAELEHYKTDNQLTAPAIPFQSMITNRAAEPDTLKWVTRLYYPVF